MAPVSVWALAVAGSNRNQSRQRTAGCARLSCAVMAAGINGCRFARGEMNLVAGIAQSVWRSRSASIADLIGFPESKRKHARLGLLPSSNARVQSGLWTLWQALQFTASLYFATPSGAPLASAWAAAYKFDVFSFQLASSPLGGLVVVRVL